MVGATGFFTAEGLMALPDFLLLAQTQPQVPDAIDVRIVDNGSSDIRWRDLLIPVGTLLAVVVGGWINRRLAETQAVREDRRERSRAEREDRLDDQRAQRERDLEEARQKRSDDAERRRAIASVRIAHEYLHLTRHIVWVGLDKQDWWPLERLVESPIRAEDEHLMAAWMTDSAWRTFATARSHIGFLPTIKPNKPAMTAATFDQVGVLHTNLTEALVALREEHDRLAAEIGQADPPQWDPLPDQSWKPFRPDGASEATLEGSGG